MEAQTQRIRSVREAAAQFPGAPIAPAEAASAIEAALRRERAAPRVLYVHVPFCPRRCLFCGYSNVPVPEPAAVERFLDDLEARVVRLAALSGGAAPPLDALFFGGGTPATLGVDGLARLVSVVTRALPMRDAPEITVELRVEDLTSAMLDGLRAAGVDRVSVGVQTFDGEVRRALGRTLDGDAALRGLERAREAGLCVVADLIATLPGLSLDAWARDLRTIAAGVVDGCSVYPLLLPPAAPLTQQVRLGVATDPREPARERACHEAVESILVTGAGFRPLTPVQFAAPSGRDAARYVRAWGLGHDVIGLGVGAFGRVDGISYLQAGPLDLATCDGRALLGPGLRALRDRVPARPGWPLALVEGDGVVARDLLDAGPSLAAAIDALIGAGWARPRDKRIELTPDGRFFGGDVAARLYAALAG